MGIRMLHRRTAHARVHATATADKQVDPDAAPSTRPLPALAPGAATPRIPTSPATALRAAAARLRFRGLLGHLPRRKEAWRLRTEVVRGYLALALTALGRLPRRRTVRRIPVFVASAAPLSERRDGSAPR